MDTKQIFRKIRRKIVVLKFTLSRGYVWCQTPFMAIIGAGIIKPYFPQIKFYQLALIALFVFMTVGYIDQKFGFLSTEQSYSTERNTLLMRGLRGELKGKNEGI